MHNFKQLEIWKLGMDLSEAVYTATVGFPKEERYGLTDQIRRSSVSIPSNIAEGAGRKTNADFDRFIHNAMGSACELETQLLLALRLKFGKPELVNPVLLELDRLQKMIFKFSEHLNAHSNR
jgi:four helix bundle protein